MCLLDEKQVQDKGSIYKPALKLIGKTPALTNSPVAKQLAEPTMLNVSLNTAQAEIQTKAKKQAQEKKKSNLELFKEELKK